MCSPRRNCFIVDCVNWIKLERMKRLNRETRKRENFLWPQHAIMLRRTAMGLNNSLISCIILCFFVGDLLFIVSWWLLPQWLILEQRRNQLPLMAQCLLFSCAYDDVLDWRMFSPTPRRLFWANKRTRQDTINDVVCLHGTRRERKQRWIMTVIAGNAIDVAHQTCIST